MLKLVGVPLEKLCEIGFHAKGVGRWTIKRQAVETACLRMKRRNDSDVGLGLAQALNAIASFPLATLFEQIDAFETLQNVALNDETADTLEAFVL